MRLIGGQGKKDFGLSGKGIDQALALLHRHTADTLVTLISDLHDDPTSSYSHPSLAVPCSQYSVSSAAVSPPHHAAMLEG